MIMKFTKAWNKFMYTPTFNVFDVLTWIIIVLLSFINNTVWWFLLFIPATVFSVWQQQRLEQQ